MVWLLPRRNNSASSRQEWFGYFLEGTIQLIAGRNGLGWSTSFKLSNILTFFYCIVGIYFMMALTVITVELYLNLLCIVGIYLMMALTLIRTIIEPSLYCRNLLHDGTHTH